MLQIVSLYHIMFTIEYYFINKTSNLCSVYLVYLVALFLFFVTLSAVFRYLSILLNDCCPFGFGVFFSKVHSPILHIEELAKF